MSSKEGEKTNGKKDWAEVVDRLASGDPLAFLEISGLITSFLARWRATDIRQDWSDVIQEVVIALLDAVSKGRINDRDAVIGYVKQVTRNKYNDHFRRRYRTGEAEHLPWTLEVEAMEAKAPTRASSESREIDLRRALERLPTAERQAFIARYAHGKTYQEVSAEMGVPVGTLKRNLKKTRETLRQRLDSRAVGPSQK